MHAFFDGVKNRVRKSIDRERSLERPAEALSRALWPYPESRLIFYVVLLAVLDYVSTFAALELSGNRHISEAGLLAKWALHSGGFAGLLLVDIVSIGTIICVAIGIRSLYRKLGFNGFGRAAYVFALIPYFISMMAVVPNNVLLTFI
jgi:hypothetical protein